MDDANPVAGPSLWRHADFLKLWSAQTISAFGARVSREGLPLAAVLTLGGGALATVIGMRAGMWIAVAGFSAAGVLALASPIRTAR